MDVHKNARLTPKGREAMVQAVVDKGLSKSEAARLFQTTAKTVAKWVRRFKAEGVAGLQDRSSRPHSSPNQTPSSVCDTIEALRRDRCTQDAIARSVGCSRSTVSRILKRLGLSLLSALEPKQARPRYERATPGEIIHIDIKKLGRFNRKGHRITGSRKGHSNGKYKDKAPGWEYVHVAVDDNSRVSFSEIKESERKEAAVEHLIAAVAYYRCLGVIVERVMTDNGSCYKSKLWARTCRELGIKHLRTKPYTPQTNGKAERFIQTALREWAYATAFENSEQRKADLPRWQHRYNWHRPHASLGKQTPISRLGLTEDNLLKLHT